MPDRPEAGPPPGSLSSGSPALAASDGAALIAAHELRIVLGDRTVLDGIDLCVAPGEVVTIIGPNGAGKSTLVRALLGLVPPASGRIDRRPGLRVGYLPQRLAIDPVLPLTVGRLMTLTQRATPAAVRAALAETGVAALAGEPVQTLSGGEFQRVLLARALLRDPDLLVLDEPVQGVDFAGEAALYELIGDIRARRGCGVLMVSHDLHVVMAATDRVVCINRHVCCEGMPDAVTRHPEYARLFGPRAASALAVYTHHHDHGHDLGGAVVRFGAAAPPAACDHDHRPPAD